MADLNEQLNKILSDPQSMQQIQGMLSALTSSGTQQEAPPPKPAPEQATPQRQTQQSGGIDPSALEGLLGTLGGSSPQPAASTGGNLTGGLTPELLQTVTRLAPLLGQVNREDDSTRLLRALRPLLGEARQKKLDEAIKILQMMRLLPLLKESGVFSGLLSGLI